MPPALLERRPRHREERLPKPSHNAFRSAVTQALADLDQTQAWLGERMAAIEGRAEPYSQQMVSAWLAGTNTMSHVQAFALERALRAKPGQLTRHLGYVRADAGPPPADPEAAIGTDTRLSKRDRRLLLALYREMLRGG